jgi:Zn-dependent protease with chaperone function
MKPRHTVYAWLIFLCLCLQQNVAHAIYEPFAETAAFSPSDEMEQRLWAESALLKGQLLRQTPAPAVFMLQEHVQAVFKANFTDLNHAVHVYVYEEPEFTAVATANGDIFLSTGLLSRIENDTELVAVLAREVAHFLNRDAARTLSYAQLGGNLKEVFSTTFAAYNLAAGLLNINSLVNSFTGLSPESVLKALQLSPEKLLDGGGTAFADYLKQRFQETGRDFGRNLTGLSVHRLSVQAVSALVKTSVYGYSERLESQADEFAFAYLESRYGNIEAYQTLMQRLQAQARIKQLNYLTFYGNEKRTEARLQTAGKWLEAKEKQRPPMAVGLGRAAAQTHLAKTEQQRFSEQYDWATVLTHAYPYLLNQEIRNAEPTRFLANTERQLPAPLAFPNDLALLRSDVLLKRNEPGDHAQALAILAHQVEANPGDWRAAKLAGNTYFKLKDFDSALLYLERALQAAEDDKEKAFLTQSRDRAAKKLQAQVKQ